jgi:hypothetical protein
LKTSNESPITGDAPGADGASKTWGVDSVTGIVAADFAGVVVAVRFDVGKCRVGRLLLGAAIASDANEASRITNVNLRCFNSKPDVT